MPNPARFIPPAQSAAQPTLRPPSASTSSSAAERTPLFAQRATFNLPLSAPPLPSSSSNRSRSHSSRRASRSEHGDIEDVFGPDEDGGATELGEGDEEERRMEGAEEGEGMGGKWGDDVRRRDVEGGTGEGKRSSTFGVIKSRSKYYIPVLSWLPSYNLELFGGDLIAGVTLACLLIPQSISYASQLGKLSPVSGLYCAAIPALVYAVLGTCRQLSMGPEAALSLLVGNTITEILNSLDKDPHHPMSLHAKTKISIEIATTIGLQVGVITFALGLFRLGFLDVVLSRALLRGFITAVGVVICVEQLIGMLGISEYLRHVAQPPTTTLSKFSFLVEHIGHTHKLTAMVSFGTLLFLITTRTIKRSLKGKKGYKWLSFIPEIFVGVLITTLLASHFGWDKRGLQVLGAIQGLGGSSGSIGFPLRRGTIRYVNDTLATSAVIAIIGFVDSIVAAKENAGKYAYPISPNRELVALGASNVIGSFFPGLVPAFGSLTRSRLNGDVGSRTQMSSLVTSACILVTIHFLLPYLFFLPKCVLSAIVLLVVFGILQEAPHDLRFYISVGAWRDLLQMLGTFILTLMVDVETGLIVSVAFSLISIVKGSTSTRIKILGHLPGEDEWVAIDDNPEAQEDIPGVLVIRIRESLNFANTGQLKERLRRLELWGPTKAHPSEAPRRDACIALVIHMSDVETIDASAIAIFYELASSYALRSVPIFFTHLHPSQKDLFARAGLVALLGEESFVDDVRKALDIIEDRGISSGFQSRQASIIIP